jgi:hypothetical protein
MPDNGTAPPRSLPLEVRAVGVLLALEIAAGFWFSLNWPPGMSVFLSQLPAFGAVGVVWGFLPHEPKDAFGAWFAERLRRPTVWITTTALLVLAIVASCFVNTVAVVGAPDDPTWIYRHTGLPEVALNDTVPVAISDADRKRLRRGTDALYFWTMTSPVGRSVWMSSPSRLTPDAVRVLPWRPTTLRYPDDFETPVVLAALPGSKALLEVKSPTPLRLLIVEAGTGDTLALTKIDAAGAMLFAFLPSSLPDSVPVTWQREAARFDSSTAQQVMQLWKTQAGARTVRRPLRVNERLRVSALDVSGNVVWTEEAILRGANSTILVAP